MIKKYIDVFVLLTAPGIELDALCLERLITAIKQLQLDSVCPLHPVYHRKRGIFESNRLYRYRTLNVELHAYCLLIRAEVWDKLPTLELHNSRWLEGYRTYLVGNQLQHGLVCNALIYEV